MSLEFLALIVQSLILPERFVYLLKKVMFPVMLCSHDTTSISVGHNFPIVCS